jgi:hypothetical protein
MTSASLPAIRASFFLAFPCLVATALAACTGADAGPKPPTDAGVGEDASSDAGDVPDAGPDPTAICDELGSPKAPFSAGPYGSERRAVADNFTLPTRAGDFVLKERWSGCETYLFILDETPFTAGWPKKLWERDHSALFMKSPSNVHYFFVSTLSTQAEVDAAQDELKGRMDTALGNLTPEEQASWARRIHYVSKGVSALDGWIAAYLKSPGLGFGIDRSQRIRDFGTPSDPTRYSQPMGWFAPNLSYLAYEAQAYEFEHAREQALDAEMPTVVSVFKAGAVSGTEEAAVVFPDAATMAGFDTMELDLTLNCEGSPEPGNCAEWDYIIDLRLCDEADPTVCDTEIARWITTYAREGRWVTDVSPMLALLKDGGPQKLRFNSQNAYLKTLDIRLLNKAKGSAPKEATYLFSGGAFDANYNAKYTPLTVSVPADAVKVELVAVITGHGYGAEVANCAEFCDHEHRFTVNGEAFMKSHPEASTNTGCVDQVPKGVVPNQYGTWFFGRGGWCPGLDVAPWVVDITGGIVKGADNTITYEGLYQGMPYVPEPSGSGQGFAANLVMTSWLIVSK